MICAKCKRDLEVSRALVLWNDDSGSDAVVVHQGTCNIREMRKSGGSAFGRNWYLDGEVINRLLELNPERSPGLRDLFCELINRGVV